MEDTKIKKVDEVMLGKVIDFLPYFRSKRTKKYGTIMQNCPDTILMEPYIYSTNVYKFMRIITEWGLVGDFSWPEWQDEAMKYVQYRELIKTADLESLQKLLITIVRKERFCAGVFADMIDKGIVLCILERLKVVREDMSDGK